MPCEKGLPCRYVVLLMCFFGYFNAYTMRANLNIALVAMVNSTSNTPTENNVSQTQECVELVEIPQNQTSHPLGSEFNWDAGTQGNILGSFYYGYFISQLPGGILAEKFGSKWICAIGFGVPSLLTLLTPLVARQGGAGALIALRSVEGLAEGVTFPAMGSLIAKWSPITERTFMFASTKSGIFFGTVVSLPITGLLCSSSDFGGWPSAFYLFGCLGIIWLLLWGILIYENPTEHPKITEAELFLIQQNQENKAEKKSSTPWKAILTSVPVWGLMIAFLGQGWGFYIMLTELPTYLGNILHFSMGKNGLASALPYVALFIFSIIVSYITDRIRSSGRMSITSIRKIMNSIAYFGSALCIGCVVLVGCDPEVIVTILVLSMALSGFYDSGSYAATVDMSPEHAGTLFGLSGTFANACGFLAPAAVGQIVKSGHTARNWHIVFLLTSGVYLITGLIFNIFGSAELQQWSSTPQEEKNQLSKHSRSPTKA